MLKPAAKTENLHFFQQIALRTNTDVVEIWTFCSMKCKKSLLTADRDGGGGCLMAEDSPVDPLPGWKLSSYITGQNGSRLPFSWNWETLQSSPTVQQSNWEMSVELEFWGSHDVCQCLSAPFILLHLLTLIALQMKTFDKCIIVMNADVYMTRPARLFLDPSYFAYRKRVGVRAAPF